MQREQTKLKVGVICGGPSLERGISLNSARSILDHLGSDEISIQPFYVDLFKNFYSISVAQLYSNTPADFDFKLAHTAKKLTLEELVVQLRQVDIVFPAVHGIFGEDGELQAILEANGIPFVGCDNKCCQQMFYKDKAAAVLAASGFATIPSAVLKAGEDIANEKIIVDFFAQHKLERAVIKPVAGGSSIGVFSAYTPSEAIEKARQLFAMQAFPAAIIEPFCYGREFTVIVLENHVGQPTALVPTEIEISYDNGQIFDYRRKYLPTNNTVWHCPPNFDDQLIQTIRTTGEEIFRLFQMRDFARLDGWVLNDGRVVFTDLNPISGMEQNSFIFQQATRIGMTHRDALWYVLANACRREGIDLPEWQHMETAKKKPVRVIFGGNTSERQVSLMSGTNIWLKLRQSKIYAPKPYLLDKDGYVWFLPYTYALNHTVEEIYDNCITAEVLADRLDRLVSITRVNLGLIDDYIAKADLPTRVSFAKFLADTQQEGAFLFLGLHGGIGENGIIQQQLADHGIPYNGSDSRSSALCMDKYLTGIAIAQIGDATIRTIPKMPVNIAGFAGFEMSDYQRFWDRIRDAHKSTSFIIKPQRDGCSTGIIRLLTAQDLERYITLAKSGTTLIPAHTFMGQNTIVELSMHADQDYIIEDFIETDKVAVENNELIYKRHAGWLEFTVGILESQGEYYALSPSITVAEGTVLSVEEKFQGGTGINITPPPVEIMTAQQCDVMRAQIVKVAKALGIENYARIDIFFNVISNEMIVIEANTLPGLTPSTVIYHQALAENPPLFPVSFLEKLIMMKMGS